MSCLSCLGVIFLSFSAKWHSDMCSLLSVSSDYNIVLLLAHRYVSAAVMMVSCVAGLPVHIVVATHSRSPNCLHYLIKHQFKNLSILLAF